MPETSLISGFLGIVLAKKNLVSGASRFKPSRCLHVEMLSNSRIAPSEHHAILSHSMEPGCAMRLGYLPGKMYIVCLSDKALGRPSISWNDSCAPRRCIIVDLSQYRLRICYPFKATNPISSNTALIHHSCITLLPSTLAVWISPSLPSHGCFLRHPSIRTIRQDPLLAHIPA